MRTTSTTHRTVQRAGLVAIVLLVVGFGFAGTAIANPGGDFPVEVGGDGPPPPDPPPPGPQDEAIPPEPPLPPPPPPEDPPAQDPGDGGGEGSDAPAEDDAAPAVSEDDGSDTDGTPGKESDRPAAGGTSVELASGSDLAVDRAEAASPALLTKLGVFLALLATTFGVLFAIAWRRQREEDDSTAPSNP